MRRRSLRVLRSSVASAALLLAAFAGLGACGAETTIPRVHVVTDLSAPRALLDRVTKLTVTVLEGGASCEPGTGVVTRGERTKEIASKALATTGCAPGARFCGDVSIPQSAEPRVFAATGSGDGDALIALGCTEATASEDTVALTIRMARYLEPAACGDGRLQPTEQCEPGGTALCDAQCQSQELLLSVGATANGTTSGAVGDKSSPSFLWPAAAGTAGWFYAFYTDRATGTPSATDIGMRVMGDDLSPLSSPPAPVAFATASLFLPNGGNGGTLPPTPEQRSQALPRAALAGGKVWVAFQDDNSPTGMGIDVHVRSMSPIGVADQAFGAPIAVNGGSAGEPGIQGAPAISASGGKLLVAWEDAAQGKIAARTLAPPSTLGSQNDVSTGTGNAHVSIAPTSSGWIAVWQSSTGIKLRALNADGTPQGAEQVVSEGGAQPEHPEVASLPDGRFAVAWAAGGGIFVQRFDAKGAKITGDQAKPVSEDPKLGGALAPAIAAAPAAGGSYVVAWLDEPTGRVAARMLGGTSGFLFNNVDGQASAFVASRGDERARAAPAVVVGGATPFVAIGWEDKTSGGSGVVVRRFPLPE